MMLRVLDLFSGIGGFSLGLERTGGFKTVAFCEIDPFCRKVLAKHWPEVPCYDDVRELTAERLRADGISVDIICGGFPCQDISVAGKGAGLEGERSGLWLEYARLIGELRPQFAIVENVAALLSRGLDCVLGDLAALGFNAEWHCIPASAVGAPHRRDRVWIMADANGKSIRDEERRAASTSAGSLQGEAEQWQRVRPHLATSGGREDVADANICRLEGQRASWQQILAPRYAERQLESRSHGSRQSWAIEPNVGRVAHGVPSRVDRLKALGNAVVPQIPELIGNAILASLKQAEAA